MLQLRLYWESVRGQTEEDRINIVSDDAMRGRAVKNNTGQGTDKGKPINTGLKVISRIRPMLK